MAFFNLFIRLNVCSLSIFQDANEADIKVQVCVFMFDLLYFNGQALVKEPFTKRRELLKQNFKEIEGEWYFATSLDTTKMEEVQDFLEESVKGREVIKIPNCLRSYSTVGILHEMHVALGFKETARD